MSGGGGGPTQTTSGSQQSQTSPWAPAQPLLESILAGIGNTGFGVTTPQSTAASNLVSAAGTVPNFGGQGTTAVNNLFNSSTAPQTGLLTNAYNQLQKTLGPYSDPNYTNPYTNPALKTAMGTLNTDITNQINSQFAAAGRDLSPGNSMALARGLSQGEGGLLAGEYNTLSGNQQAAANALFSAGGSTATTGAGLNQIPLQNQIAGISAAGAVPGLLTQPATTALGAANTQFGLPLANIGQVESLTTPIAGLGQSSTGSMQQTVQQSNPLLNQILGAGLGGAGILGSLGFAPFSDKRVKENIRKVGMLNDGLPVYSYNYKFDPTKQPQIGLLAQDVEEEIPEAVSKDALGLRHVDYGLATARAANQMPA
jgi:hypothetical protein